MHEGIRKCCVYNALRPGAVARSDTRPPGMQTVAGFDPHVRQNILVLRFGHENVSTIILSLPLIQEGQLACPGGLPRNSVARLTDRSIIPIMTFSATIIWVWVLKIANRTPARPTSTKKPKQKTYPFSFS